jgi:hypothetical protein
MRQGHAALSAFVARDADDGENTKLKTKQKSIGREAYTSASQDTSIGPK